MTTSGTFRGIALAAGLGLAAACGGGGHDTARPVLRPLTRSVRITMTALHQAGGVPPGWALTAPAGDAAAGRETFVDQGCCTCHVVKGESFAEKSSGVGPELSGMGSHHPAEYFLESIINPDAVLIDGPGYVGPDGRSVMPSYPDLTVRQLADLVAYLASLKETGFAAHAMPAPMPPPSEIPPPEPHRAASFFVQGYAVQQGRLAEFQRWFRTEGAERFLAYDGLVSIDTFVDVRRVGPPLVTVFGFTDDAARDRFLNDPATQALGDRFDSFIGPHGHDSVRLPPLYRAPSLSAP